MIRCRAVLFVSVLALSACGSGASSRGPAAASRNAPTRAVEDFGERRVAPDPGTTDAAEDADSTGTRVDLGADATQGLDDFLT
jgi:hypothetical protein